MPLASSAVCCPWEDHTDKVHQQQFLPQPLFQASVVLCQFWSMMFYFASCNYVTSLREGSEGEKDCYLSRWLDCSRKMYVVVWENFLTKFSDEITPDSLRGISVTNKTGISYYAPLWIPHSCCILYANSGVCWTALWADSLHLPGKNSHTANLSSSDPISTGGPRVTVLVSKEHEEDSAAQILLNLYEGILFKWAQ